MKISGCSFLLSAPPLYNIGEGGGCHCVLEEEDSIANKPSSIFHILEAWRAVFCLCELCGGSRSANLAWLERAEEVKARLDTGGG